MNPRKGLRAVQCLLTTILCVCTVSFADAQLNFAFTASTATYSHNSGSATTVTSSNNTLSGLINIGFNFQYGCNIYTQLRISSYGYISLGYNTLTNVSSNDLRLTGNGPLIAPLWDNLGFSGSGNMNYLLSGTTGSRILTIEWNKMLWDQSASGAVISFELKLHEGTNVIDFVYKQETAANSKSSVSGGASIGLNGGIRSTDYYSMVSPTASPTVNYGTVTNSITALPATNQMYTWTPQNMAFQSLSIKQASTDSIPVCNNLNQPVICMKVFASGCTGGLNVSQIVFNMNGSTIPGTNTNDVDSIHVYYTGNSAGFAPVLPFGGTGVKPVAGNITINSTQALVSDTNYFWIAYDIDPATSTNKHVVDAQFVSMTISGSTPTPVTVDTAGSRAIALCDISPGGITRPSFWIKASSLTSTLSDGGAVTSWGDLSGNGRSPVQVTAAYKPLYKNNSTDNINFNPTVNFIAADSNFMPISTGGVMSVGKNPYDAYVMIKPGSGNLSAPGKFLFAGSGINGFNAFDARSGNTYLDSWDLNDLIVSNVWTTSYPSLATFDFNSVQREMFVSGSSVGTQVGNNRWSIDANDALGCQLAASPHLEFYDGGIAEIITYANTSHNQLVRNKIESYLAIKYGVTLSHDYVDSHGDTVWRHARNTAFNNNIMGIAYDRVASQLQKQSKSTSVTSDVLTLYLGATKYVDQASNTSGFSGGDTTYFMVGSNGLQLDFGFNTNSDVPAGVCCRLQRAWLTQKKNFNSGNITMEWNLSSIGSGSTPLFAPDLRLLVDNDGVFVNATVLQPTFTVSGEVVTATVPASSITTAQPYFTLGSVANRTPLALSIQSFTAVCQNKNIRTNWVIGQTTDACSFTIERSNNGGAFSAVGEVAGDPSGNLSYIWTDEHSLPGTSSYRLKVTDNTTGAVLYSSTAAVSGCENGNVTIVGSDPVTGKSVMLSLQLLQSSMVDIGFYDLLGQRIELPGLTGRKSIGQGVTNLTIPPANLASGVYILTVTINDERQVFRVKQ